MNILSWLKAINILALLTKLYPIVREAVKEVARESKDENGWTDEEKKTLALSLIHQGIESFKLSLPKEVYDFLPDAIEIIWHFIVKREFKIGSFF